MHRAWQRAVIGLAAPLLGAWHVGQTFDDPPGAGGGGGLFYTGSPRERGWDCTACHVGAEREIAVAFTVDPPELLDGTWTPGVVYTFRLVLDELQGLRSPTSNHNGFAVTVVDRELRGVGELAVSEPAAFHLRGDNILATSGFEPNRTEWTFTWEAPAAGPEVLFSLGLVDGDGARTRPGVTLTDPLGDDVFLASFSAFPATP